VQKNNNEIFIGTAGMGIIHATFIFMGTESPNETSQIASVAPNPVQTTATLHFAFTPQETPRIELYSANGELMTVGVTTDLSANLAKVDCSGLPSGWYYCVVNSGKDIQREAIMIVR
jgi:hypothetical protein